MLNSSNAAELTVLDELVEILRTGTTCKLKRPGNGRDLSTLAIGGTLNLVINAETVGDVGKSFMALKQCGLSCRIIGAGSNILIPDEGLAEPVLMSGRNFRYVKDLGQGRFEVGSTTSLMSLARELSNAGFSGLEFAGGIPASIGGAVFMNAGAHGSEMAQVLEAVQLVTQSGDYLELSRSELEFSYRHCNLPKDCFVTAAIIKLTPGDSEKISRLRSEYLAERKLRQPLTMPSAGSVFKNPDKVPGAEARSAGWLIEQCGLKGFTLGGARISNLHANWIVNYSKIAMASEVRELIQIAQKAVQEKFQITLQPEIICL